MCPDPIELDALAQGSLGERDRARVIAHLDGCPGCRELVAELARMRSTPGAFASSSAALGRADTLLAARTPSSAPAPLAASIGRYRIERKLGSGGMGTVLEAYDPELARAVAIKVLHPDPGGDVEMLRALLLREAQAMARLNHPNVVAVFDVGTTENQIFIAMELVIGTTLADWLKAKRSRTEIVDAFVQAGRGLVAAHEAGLVHRDFKPANVLVGADGRVRVSDFGLARNPARPRAPSPSAFETQAGGLIGTPSYMSPEQWRGQAADARSDQWSFALALFEALAGRHPFAAESLDALQAAVLERTRARSGRSSAALETRSREGAVAASERSLRLDRCAPRRSRHRNALARLPHGAVRRARRRRRTLRRRRDRLLAAHVHTGETADGVRQGRAQSRHVLERREEGGHWREAPAKSPALVTFDAYAKDWRAMRSEVCEAAARKEVSDDLRDRKNACLDRHLAAFDGALKVIEAGARDTGAVTGGLPLVADCADDARVESGIFLPSSADDRAKVERIEDDLEEARAFTNASRLAEAAPLVERAFDAAKALGFDPVVAEAAFRRASLLEDRSDYPGAERAYKEAFATARAARDDEVMRAASIALVRLVGTEEGRPADAEEWIQTARAEVKRADTDADGKARLLENEADVDMTAGRYQDAKSKLDDVLRMREATLAPNDTNLAVAHANVGAALEKLGRYDDALAEERKALDIVTAVAGDDAPITATYLRGVGEIEYRLGQYDDAKATFERTLTILGHFADTTSDASTTHEALGLVYRGLGDPAHAIDELRQSITLRESLVGPDHPFVAGELKNLADALEDAGRANEALDALARAESIMTKAHGEHAPEAAELRCDRADVLDNLGRHDDAITIYETALVDITKAYGDANPLAGRCSFNLGLAEKRKGDMPAAAKAYEVALHAFQVAYGDDARQTKRARAALEALRAREPK